MRRLCEAPANNSLSLPDPYPVTTLLTGFGAHCPGLLATFLAVVPRKLPVTHQASRITFHISLLAPTHPFL
jgi:hypothetical protein